MELKKNVQQTEVLDKAQWAIVNMTAYIPSAHLSILLFEEQNLAKGIKAFK